MIMISPKIIYRIIFVLTFVRLIGFFQFSQAQVEILTTTNSENQLIEFIQPENRKYPQNRGKTTNNRITGGGRRPYQESQEIMILVPPKSKINEKESCLCELTVSEYPTFWLYIPSNIPINSRLRFQLRGEDTKSVLVDKKAIEFSVLKTGGILGFQLPSSQKPLEVNKHYYWYFKVLLPTDPDAPLELSGWITRIEDNYSQGSTTPQDLSYNYASNGIWYDALTELAKFRYQNPTTLDIEENWKSLLHSADKQKLLENIADQPIVNYHSADDNNQSLNDKSEMMLVPITN